MSLSPVGVVRPPPPPPRSRFHKVERGRAVDIRPHYEVPVPDTSLAVNLLPRSRPVSTLPYPPRTFSYLTSWRDAMGAAATFTAAARRLTAVATPAMPLIPPLGSGAPAVPVAPRRARMTVAVVLAVAVPPAAAFGAAIG